VLLEDLKEVARLEGRATQPDIKESFEPPQGLARGERSIDQAGAS
jgi:hypothetical protein